MNIQSSKNKYGLSVNDNKPTLYSFVFDIGRNGAKLVYNSRTNALMRVSDDCANDVVGVLDGSLPVSCLDEETGKALQKGGFLVGADFDELQSLKADDDTARHRTTRLSLTIAPTLACNFKCPYCYQDHKAKHMKPDVVESIKAYVGNALPDLDLFSVSWYGGEPLLAKKQLMELQEFFYESCKEQDVDFHSAIITNGYLLTREFCQFLSNTGLSFVQITLDGTKETHDQRRILNNGRGTFDAIYKNVKMAAGYFKKIALRVNVDKENPRAFEAISAMIEADGLVPEVQAYPGKVDAVTDASMNYGNNCYSTAEYAAYEIETAKNMIARNSNYSSFPTLGNGCGALCSNAMVIDAEGLLFKCWNDVGELDKSVGVLGPDGRIINESIVRWEGFDRFDSAECRSCRFLPICLSECPYEEIALGDESTKCTRLRYSLEEIVKLKYINDMRQELHCGDFGKGDQQ